jgi:hypothetical protein
LIRATLPSRRHSDQSVGAVFWAQIARAIGSALVTYLGISFLQSLLPHRAGAAAALFSNSGQLGQVLAALGIGGLAKAFGYESISSYARFSAPLVSDWFASRRLRLIRPRPRAM